DEAALDELLHTRVLDARAQEHVAVRRVLALAQTIAGEPRQRSGDLSERLEIEIDLDLQQAVETLEQAEVALQRLLAAMRGVALDHLVEQQRVDARVLGLLLPVVAEQAGEALVDVLAAADAGGVVVLGHPFDVE